MTDLAGITEARSILGGRAPDPAGDEREQLTVILHGVRALLRAEFAIAVAISAILLLVPFSISWELPLGLTSGIVTPIEIFGLVIGLVVVLLLGSLYWEMRRLGRDVETLGRLDSLPTQDRGAWLRAHLGEWRRLLVRYRDGLIILGFVLGATGTWPFGVTLFRDFLSSGGLLAPPWVVVFVSSVVVPPVLGPVLCWLVPRRRVAYLRCQLERLSEDSGFPSWERPPSSRIPPTAPRAESTPEVARELDDLGQRLRTFEGRVTETARRGRRGLILTFGVLFAILAAEGALTTLSISYRGVVLPLEVGVFFLVILLAPISILLCGAYFILRTTGSLFSRSAPKGPEPMSGVSSSTLSSAVWRIRAVYRATGEGRRIGDWTVVVVGVLLATVGTFPGVYLVLSIASQWGVWAAVAGLALFGAVLPIGGAGAVWWTLVRRYRTLATQTENYNRALARLQEEFWSRY